MLSVKTFLCTEKPASRKWGGLSEFFLYTFTIDEDSEVGREDAELELGGPGERDAELELSGPGKTPDSCILSPTLS